MEFKNRLLQNLQNSKSIAILTHNFPDGDGAGSCFALQTILKNLKINSTVIFTNELSEKYFFLNPLYFLPNNKMKFETLIFVDMQAQTLLGSCEILLKKAKNVFVIDHHPICSNPIKNAYTLINPKIFCAAAIIDQLFSDEIENMDFQSKKFYAQWVYIAILNDTNGFINSNVDETTFELCKKMCRFGINPTILYEKFLLKKNLTELKYRGKILQNIESYEDGKILLATSDFKSAYKRGINPNDPPSVIADIKGTKGVIIIIYLKEIEEENFRVSLRSQIIDVGEISVEFGGGGHSKAAGFSIRDNIEKVKDIILKVCTEKLSANYGK